jgi:excisionase family DNA binding protein
MPTPTPVMSPQAKAQLLAAVDAALASPPPTPSGRWIDVPTEAVAYTGLSLKTLRRRIRDGTLPAYKVAGTRAVRVNTSDLDAMFLPINGGGPA